MKTRDAVLQYQYTAKDTETKTTDLNVTEPISAIEIEVESVNGASGNLGNFISDIVTKIEVVDGSDVLESLNMSQLEALHFYKTGKTPCLFPSEWTSGVQRHNAMLLFGRHLWDRDYNLDCSKFDNPQLKVTFNKAAIRAAGATGFAAGDNIKFSAIAKCFSDVPAAKQFLMQKQIDSFTSVSSGDKRIDLPIDYVYRMLMMRAYLQQSDINEIITDIKLTADTDRFIPFNRKTQQLDASVFSQFGASRIKHDILTSDGLAVRAMHNKEGSAVIACAVAGLYDILGIDYFWSNELKLNMSTHAGASESTPRAVTCTEEGHALHATLPILFGRLEEPTDWFNPKEYSKLELVLTQATASAICEIVAEQVRPQ